MIVDNLEATALLSADIQRISLSFQEMCFHILKETLCKSCTHRNCDEWCLAAFKAGINITNAYILQKLRWN